MNVLLIGSGGREHAIAWKLAQSPRLARLYTLPGNPGTARHGRNLEGDVLDSARIVSLAKQHAIDLAVIGPEAPLAAGLADTLRAEGIPTFGPGRAGAQLEASKAFAKEFMRAAGIPTAPWAAFEDFGAACAHLESLQRPCVLKASGLAAGKGVYLPEDAAQARQILEELILDRRLGAAGARVVIEERLCGPELSVLAFTDGQRFALMPPARDHKRALDGDLGPNTGGMGALTPSPDATPELLETIAATILAPTLTALRQRAIEYRGVLYIGLILTRDGPHVLEYNCRFGDPEAQAILPLLDTDLLEVMAAAALGALPEVRWRAESALCVVLASGGYPGEHRTGAPIAGLEDVKDAMVFHAGTREQDEQVLTAGGRVLGVTALGADPEEAARRAYQAIACIRFAGMHFRHDIGGRRAAYAEAGVDIEAGKRAVQRMRSSVEATYGPQVLSGLGAFGGLFDAADLQGMARPVLASSTDGVGTKVAVAAQAGMPQGIGQDIVNHCINDILVQGARPLFFMDYIAAGTLDPDWVAEIVVGMAAACRAAGCVLLGGETAEMPGVYRDGSLDVAGTIVGVVERERVLPRGDIRAGDVLIGLASSGLHTNGYSLARKVFEGVDLRHTYPEIGRPLGEALLVPHRSYLEMLLPVLEEQPGRVKALAHITGGGFFENLPRALPRGLGARICPADWPIPALFQLIETRGRVPREEMFRVFNMGVGMVVVTAPEHAGSLLAALGEGWPIGEVLQGEGVRLEA
jgi:phosphoribosylamine--glycine ligase/phosphoribosylaminoimidazole synthetase